HRAGPPSARPAGGAGGLPPHPRGRAREGAPGHAPPHRGPGRGLAPLPAPEKAPGSFLLRGAAGRGDAGLGDGPKVVRGRTALVQPAIEGAVDREALLRERGTRPISPLGGVLITAVRVPGYSRQLAGLADSLLGQCVWPGRTIRCSRPRGHVGVP